MKKIIFLILLFPTVALSQFTGYRHVIFPNAISNMKFWLAADRGVGTSLTPGFVDTWASNFSPTVVSFTQATAAKRPAFSNNQLNGLPGILFDGVDDYMNCTSASLNFSQPITMICVVKFVTFSTAPRICAGSTSTSAVNSLQIANIVSNDEYTIRGSTSPIVTTSSVVTTNANIVTSTFNGASSSIFVNGVSLASGTITAVSNAGFTIGCDGNLSRPGNFYLFEIITYDKVLSTAERQVVELYLSRKYNLPI